MNYMFSSSMLNADCNKKAPMSGVGTDDEVAIVVPETSEEIANILDRFTDPKQKRKRLEAKEEQRKRKRRKVFLTGKTFARDQWNESPSALELAAWRLHFTPPSVDVFPPLPPGIEDEEDDPEWLSDCMGIPLRTSDDSSACILHFFSTIEACRAWLQQRLQELGWTKNMTGYDPVEVSYSSAELLHATWQCYQMAVKQRRWL